MIAESKRTALIIQSAQKDSLAHARRVLLASDSSNTVTAELPLIDGFAVNVNSSSLPQLIDLRKERPELLISPDQEIELHEPQPTTPPGRLEIAAQTLHMQEVWDQGYRGQGIGIAIVDTGIAPHPDLSSRIVAFHDTVNGATAPYDDHGHGTHVSGIAAGNGSASSGRYKGMAPEASLVGVKVLDSDGKGSTSRIVSGIQWAVDNQKRYNIRAMNISIGGKAWIGWQHDPMAQAVEKATQSGIAVAIAAGNSGPDPQTIESPGISPSAITVANLDEHFTNDRSDDTIADSSSRGPTSTDGLAKPDVAAPGTWIYSCEPHGGYVYMSGTSMATPMVAGTCALLAQASPGSTPTDLKEALMLNPAPLKNTPPEAQGRGMIDPPVALAYLKAGRKA